MAKKYTIVCYHRGRTTEYTGTVAELVETFRYTLECGHSWEREKGCKKVNPNPTTIKGLLRALDNSVYNTQSSCYDRDSYDLKEAC